MKYAIYSTEYGGYYAKEYIDNLKDCKNLLGGWLVKQEDLPIVVNRVGGRCPFYPVEENFVKIIECGEDDEPLTREQMYPKNSDKFEFGWIDTDGNTYTCGYEDHYRSAEAICEELGCKTYNAEKKLEDMGWLKVTGSWMRGEFEKKVYAIKMFITKKQADTLFDLGLIDVDEDLKFLVEDCEKYW